jgi:RNA polymerase sigma-70 factor (ECF subfamily)
MAEKSESEVVITSQPQVRERTDDELVAAARAGDEAAFTQLFKRHNSLVSRLGYRFFSRREQVEEIIQEAFVKAYLALDNYQGGHEKSFVSWLARITVHACYDELRRIKKRSESRLGDLSQEEEEFLTERLRDVSAGSNVEGATISRDLAGKLLSRLKPEDRVVLTLLKQEELSIAEIAELTGWTSAKVKMRSHRAQQGLRRVLKKFV